MKKVVVIALVVSLALFLGFSAPAQPRVGLEVHGLYGFEFSNDYAELDNGWGGGASLVLCLGELVKLDIGGDYIHTKEKNPSNSDVDLIPITATLRVGPQIDLVYLYVGGGAGYSFNDLGLIFAGLEPYVLKDCFTYHGCAGCEVSFTSEKQIGLRVEGRYVWMKPEIRTKATGATEDWKMEHFQARAGLIFYF